VSEPLKLLQALAMQQAFVVASPERSVCQSCLFP